jgi:putative transcriptional regulator
VPRKKEPTLTNCVRELRADKAGMTQQELADRVGVTRQTIVALEGGAYTPSLALALRIARVFGKTTEDVFHLDEPVRKLTN